MAVKKIFIMSMTGESFGQSTTGLSVCQVILQPFQRVPRHSIEHPFADRHFVDESTVKWKGKCRSAKWFSIKGLYIINFKSK